MICGHVCVFLRVMYFCLCENQSNLHLHVLSADSGGGIFIL